MISLASTVMPCVHLAQRQFFARRSLDTASSGAGVAGKFIWGRDAGSAPRHSRAFARRFGGELGGFCRCLSDVLTWYSRCVVYRQVTGDSTFCRVETLLKVQMLRRGRYPVSHRRRRFSTLRPIAFLDSPIRSGFPGAGPAFPWASRGYYNAPIMVSTPSNPPLQD